MKKQIKVINELKKEFPNKFFKTSEEFDKEYKNGIWFSGESEYLNPKIKTILKKHNFMIEPYDSGTLLAFEQ